MSGLSRRSSLGGLAASAVVSMLRPSQVHAQKRGPTLRFVAEADLRIFDPVGTTAYITRNHGYLV